MKEYEWIHIFSAQVYGSRGGGGAHPRPEIWIGSGIKFQATDLYQSHLC